MINKKKIKKIFSIYLIINILFFSGCISSKKNDLNLNNSILKDEILNNKINNNINNEINENFVNSAWVVWSMGCQGCPEPTFKNLVRLAQISQKYQKNNLFDYTLLSKKDFGN